MAAMATAWKKSPAKASTSRPLRRIGHVVGVGLPDHYPCAVRGSVHPALHTQAARLYGWRRLRLAIETLSLHGLVAAAPEVPATATAMAGASVGVLVVAASPAAVVVLVVVVLVLGVLVVDHLKIVCR